MLSIALSKGRISTKPCLYSRGRYRRVRRPEASRKLIIPTSHAGCGSFVRATDCRPTAIRAADLGIAGGDILADTAATGSINRSTSGCALPPDGGRAQDFPTSRPCARARLRVATKYLQRRASISRQRRHVDLISCMARWNWPPDRPRRAIVDLVSTGHTLKANNLVAVEAIADVSARDRQPGRVQVEACTNPACSNC